ncbi:MAG TPA: hypothetical protein VGO43_16020 [Pyrinomonadaceae bacterium]|jgi:hypothetical protein|nr:hypothetical protein [Pyrinomonadaceae bacterium]
MKIKTVSHAVFAMVLIGLGILGLAKGGLAAGWEPVPESMPARQVLAYICDLIYLGCGIGLLWRRTAIVAARVLFGWLLLWLLVLRIPWLIVSFQIGTWWSASSTAVLVGTAWVLYSSLADERDRRRFGFFTGDTGLRIARVLFGLGLIPLGLAHFLYLDATAPLVPAWMIWPVFWSYFTGGAFVAAGLAITVEMYARLAASLVTLQFGLLTLLVWVPRVVTGNVNAFQWNEFLASILLTAAAWVVADSYRGTSWLAARKARSE